jgi:hypothetical protein
MGPRQGFHAAIVQFCDRIHNFGLCNFKSARRGRKP